MPLPQKDKSLDSLGHQQVSMKKITASTSRQKTDVAIEDGEKTIRTSFYGT